MALRALKTITMASVLILVTGVGASPAWPQSGWYVGFGAGQADSDAFHDRDLGFKIYGGWRFLPQLAAEFAYVGLGDYGPSGNRYEQQGVSAQFVGSLPLGESGASLFAKAGIFSWSIERSGGYGCCFIFVKDSGTDPTVGAGLQFDVHRHAALRVEWERFFDIGDGDVDLVTAGLLYRF